MCSPDPTPKSKHCLENISFGGWISERCAPLIQPQTRTTTEKIKCFFKHEWALEVFRVLGPVRARSGPVSGFVVDRSVPASEQGQSRAWKLWLLLPRMLLHRPPGVDSSRDNGSNYSPGHITRPKPSPPTAPPIQPSNVKPPEPANSFI